MAIRRPKYHRSLPPSAPPKTIKTEPEPPPPWSPMEGAIYGVLITMGDDPRGWMTQARSSSDMRDEISITLAAMKESGYNGQAWVHGQTWDGGWKCIGTPDEYIKRITGEWING